MNKNEFSEKFKSVAESINITINDIDLYYQAFTHPSFANENNVKHYERLEFLGDALLNFVIAERLFTRQDISEGEMTKLRANYVCTQAISEYCLLLGLETCLMLGKGAKDHKEDSQAVLADLFESFVGALYLDHKFDLNYIRDFFVNTLYPRIKSHRQDFFIDYKSKLQEYIQSESRQGVTYQLISEQGPPHNKIFEVGVSHEEVRLGLGTGKTKKEAEQRAAKDALDKLVR